jgi:hypothetical protein
LSLESGFLSFSTTILQQQRQLAIFFAKGSLWTLLFLAFDLLLQIAHDVFFHYDSDQIWLWGEQQGWCCCKLQFIVVLLQLTTNPTTTPGEIDTFFSKY